MDDDTRDFGPQPLQEWMARRGLENHDLVEASPDQLTHKQVQRAKSGRRLTLKMMMKVADAMNAAIFEKLPPEKKGIFKSYMHRDLFNYAKGYDATRADPNENL